MTQRKDLWWVAPATLALLILIGASVAANFQYGLALGGPIIGGISIASDILKVVALIAVFALWRYRYRLQAAALFILFLGFTAWSLLSAVGFISAQFSTLEDSRGKTASQWQTLTAQIDQLQGRRASVDAARPQKTIQAEMDAVLRIPGVNGCTVIDGPLTREHCPKYDTLKAELGNAEAAVWLDGRLDELRKELGAADRVSVVDPRTDSITAVSGLAVSSVALIIKFFFAGLIETATAVGLWAIWSPFFARRKEPPAAALRKPDTEPQADPKPPVLAHPEPQEKAPELALQHRPVVQIDVPLKAREDPHRKIAFSKDDLAQFPKLVSSKNAPSKVQEPKPSHEKKREGCVIDWVHDCTSQTPDKGTKVATGEAYKESYLPWCRNSNKHPIGQSKFTRILVAQFKVKERKRDAITGTRWIPGLLVHNPQADAQPIAKKRAA
jgi:hypothetical protein